MSQWLGGLRREAHALVTAVLTVPLEHGDYVKWINAGARHLGRETEKIFRICLLTLLPGGVQKDGVCVFEVVDTRLNAQKKLIIKNVFNPIHFPPRMWNVNAPDSSHRRGRGRGCGWGQVGCKEGVGVCVGGRRSRTACRQRVVWWSQIESQYNNYKVTQETKQVHVSPSARQD